MHPLLNVAISESKCHGFLRIDSIRRVTENKEPYETTLRSTLMHSSLQKKKKQGEKTESITRSIQNRQEKNMGESFRGREKGDTEARQFSHVRGAPGVGKETASQDYIHQNPRLEDYSPENNFLKLLLN